MNNSPYYKNQPRALKNRIISPYGRGGSIQQLNIVGNNQPSIIIKQNRRYKDQNASASIDVNNLYKPPYDIKSKGILKSNRGGENHKSNPTLKLYEPIRQLQKDYQTSQKQVHISNYDMLIRKNKEYQKQRQAQQIQSTGDTSPKKSRLSRDSRDSRDKQKISGREAHQKAQYM